MQFAGGLVNRNDDGEKSYSWLVSYSQTIDERFAWSISWLNEGHLDNHRRDGPSVQLWVRKYVLNRNLLFAAGAGPYLSFDTNTEGMGGGDYENVHKLGGFLSMTAA